MLLPDLVLHQVMRIVREQATLTSLLLSRGNLTVPSAPLLQLIAYQDLQIKRKDSKHDA